MNVDSIFGQLHAEGLAASPTPPEASASHASSWHIRVLVGFGGWLAGVFLAGFFGTMFTLLFRDAGPQFVLGIALCGVAALLYRRAEGDVIEQFALAISMCGQVFLALAIMQAMKHADQAAFLVAAVQALLVVVMKNTLHRLISTLFAAAALYYALDTAHLVGLGAFLVALPAAVLWARESAWRASRHAEIFLAVTWGLSLALLFWATPAHGLDSFRRLQMIPEALGYGAGLATFVMLASSGARAAWRAAALAGVGLLAWLAKDVPGLIAATLLLCAGFRAGSPGLLGIAAVGGVGYLSAYYYQLDRTLLERSLSLAMTGAALLMAAGALHLLRSRKP
jgi:uncharacterized membrane protein